MNLITTLTYLVCLYFGRRSEFLHCLGGCCSFTLPDMSFAKEKLSVKIAGLNRVQVDLQGSCSNVSMNLSQ